MKSSRLSWLLSPWTIGTGMISGVLIGWQYRELAFRLAPLGEAYLSLLQMCIIPIMITAVLSSLGRLLISGEAAVYMGRLLIVFILGLFIASGVGLSVGMVAKPGTSLSKKAQVTLGKKISETETTSFDLSKSTNPDLLSFVKEIVPNNVIGAISQGKNLPILFFFILLGIALGLVRSPAGKTALDFIGVFYDALLRIITWVMFGLPFGLCCLLAYQVAQIGLDIIFALLKLVIFCYLCAFILIGIYGIAMWLKIGGSFFRSFIALKETFVVALGTSSSFATIPSALHSLRHELHLDEQATRLVVPLGVSLNPHGTAMYFAISAVFIAQLYNTSLSAPALIIILVGSILAGIAATGAPGAGALAMIALILEPLGLPVATAVVFLTAVDPILDPIITLTTVHANCTAAAMVAKDQHKQISLEEQ